MEIYIIYALILAILQMWLIPMTIDIKNLKWMMGSRDEARNSSQLHQRAVRAGANLQESLPAFLALVLAAMILEINVDAAACWWLVFRTFHGLLYLAGTNYLRTLAYFGSIGSLVAMVIAIMP